MPAVGFVPATGFAGPSAWSLLRRRSASIFSKSAFLTLAVAQKSLRTWFGWPMKTCARPGLRHRVRVMELPCIKGAVRPLRCVRSTMAQSSRPLGGPAQRPASVLGIMEFGRRTDQEASRALLQAFLEQGHRELDTAHMYGGAHPSASWGRCWRVAAGPQ
ncbi:hypothetical protein KIL84_019856 [Mauremys mutica]|uniref:NADP-dependent oxidoreductase domain-containing protein n=1 Tax=Mauremys mutica TaxID=74926 RepID=A0A9D4B3Q0_9SAUR|nr:hypothetical protein KIL84_019856 [Mauremys mutica]